MQHHITDYAVRRILLQIRVAAVAENERYVAQGLLVYKFIGAGKHGVGIVHANDLVIVG